MSNESKERPAWAAPLNVTAGGVLVHRMHLWARGERYGRSERARGGRCVFTPNRVEHHETGQIMAIRQPDNTIVYAGYGWWHDSFSGHGRVLSEEVWVCELVDDDKATSAYHPRYRRYQNGRREPLFPPDVDTISCTPAALQFAALDNTHVQPCHVDLATRMQWMSMHCTASKIRLGRLVADTSRGYGTAGWRHKNLRTYVDKVTELRAAFGLDPLPTLPTGTKGVDFDNITIAAQLAA